MVPPLRSWALLLVPLLATGSLRADSDPYPVRDIVSEVLPQGSSPRAFTVVGDQVFFEAAAGPGGLQLWRTDGTTEGTEAVADLFAQEPHFTRWRAAGDRFLFEAGGLASFLRRLPDQGPELWVSDGTDNWEMLVKVLDGCGFNAHRWVFAAATTTVAFELQVEDTATGAVRSYSNPSGQVARTVTDTTAFACD